jgi:3-hydroxyacyl-[acyl-carrier-protein] dehydratase
MKLTYEDILRLIPHRPPFLFVKSAEIIGDREIHGICAWDTDNPAFLGHFPEFPIVPGVLLIEAAAQLTGVQVVHSNFTTITPDKDDHPLGVLTLVRKATITRPVFPGVAVQYRITIDPPIGSMVIARCEAFTEAGNQRVLKCELGFASVRPSQLLPNL